MDLSLLGGKVFIEVFYIPHTWKIICTSIQKVSGHTGAKINLHAGQTKILAPTWAHVIWSRVDRHQSTFYFVVHNKFFSLLTVIMYLNLVQKNTSSILVQVRLIYILKTDCDLKWKSISSILEWLKICLTKLNCKEEMFQLNKQALFLKMHQKAKNNNKNYCSLRRFIIAQDPKRTEKTKQITTVLNNMHWNNN